MKVFAIGVVFVGTNSVVQAKKDGHTVLYGPNAPLTIRAVLDPQAATYDALRDLAPLGILASDAAPDEHASEIRDEPARVSAMVKKAGLRK